MRFDPPDPAHRSVLRQVLERAAAHGPAGVAVFDLDSTLFDNRPRQTRIIREFGQSRGILELTRCGPGHWESGWDLKHVLRATGLPEARVEAVFEELQPFWTERFYAGAYCREDLPIEGAAAFVRAIQQAGATLAYCTGRPEAMREGSVESLRSSGFPVPGSERVELIMKPEHAASDDAFKRSTHERLRELGVVIAAFDNEPTHINDYRTSFPAALVVHLATDHSGRDVVVSPDIPAIADFRSD